MCIFKQRAQNYTKELLINSLFNLYLLLKETEEMNNTSNNIPDPSPMLPNLFTLCLLTNPDWPKPRPAATALPPYIVDMCL